MILGVINRSPELPKVNEVNPAKELKRIYSITEKIKQATSHDGQTTSDKDINPNNTNTRGQEIDEDGNTIVGGKYNVWTKDTTRTTTNVYRNQTGDSTLIYSGHDSTLLYKDKRSGRTYKGQLK